MYSLLRRRSSGIQSVLGPSSPHAVFERQRRAPRIRCSVTSGQYIRRANHALACGLDRPSTRQRRSGNLLRSWCRRHQCMGRSLRLFKCTESLRLRPNIMRGSTKHVVLPKAARLHPWMWSRPIRVQAVLRTSFLEGLFAGMGFLKIHSTDKTST